MPAVRCELVGGIKDGEVLMTPGPQQEIRYRSEQAQRDVLGERTLGERLAAGERVYADELEDGALPTDLVYRFRATRTDGVRLYDLVRRKAG